MNWELKETEEFEKRFSKLPREIQNRFNKQFIRLKENPYSIGKPLGYKWFRELKNDKYRVYYLIYNNDISILLVRVSEKKDQQRIIDFIKANIDVFKELISKDKNNINRG